jgi:hypothetical protein
VTHATIPVALRISGQQHRLGDPRFRTFQVRGKDGLAVSWHPERAANRTGGGPRRVGALVNYYLTLPL